MSGKTVVAGGTPHPLQVTMFALKPRVRREWPVWQGEIFVEIGDGRRAWSLNRQFFRFSKAVDWIDAETDAINALMKAAEVPQSATKGQP